MFAISFNLKKSPCPKALIMIFSYSDCSLNFPLYLITYSKEPPLFCPNEPVAASRLWLFIAAVTSVG